MAVGVGLEVGVRVAGDGKGDAGAGIGAAVGALIATRVGIGMGLKTEVGALCSAATGEGVGDGSGFGAASAIEFVTRFWNSGYMTTIVSSVDSTSGSMWCAKMGPFGASKMPETVTTGFVRGSSPDNWAGGRAGSDDKTGIGFDWPLGAGTITRESCRPVTVVGKGKENGVGIGIGATSRLGPPFCAGADAVQEDDTVAGRVCWAMSVSS